MEISEEIKAVKDVIQAILKSKKILRMYPSNNLFTLKPSKMRMVNLESFFIIMMSCN